MATEADQFEGPQSTPVLTRKRRRGARVRYSESVLDSLVHGIYEAAVRRTAWITFLAAFAGALGSTHPSIYLADSSEPEGSIEISVGLDESTRRAYREYYVRRNVWIKAARPLLRPGHIRSSDQVCSRREFLSSEWYADFCRPLGWMRGIGATIIKDGTTTANIGAFRSGRRPEYSGEDFALVGALLPHLQRAFSIHRNLSESVAHGQAIESALDGISSPVLLVAQDGTVLFMNTAAEELTRISDGLVIEAGKLRAMLPNEATSLGALISGAANTSAGKSRKAGGSLLISRPLNPSPLEILVSPLPTGQTGWFLQKSAVAAVFVNARAKMTASRSWGLIERYGLTASEARVAVALSQGLSGKQICRELGISYNTLKTHLRHAYAKTRTNHQSDLVRLTLSGTYNCGVQTYHEDG